MHRVINIYSPIQFYLFYYFFLPFTWFPSSFFPFFAFYFISLSFFLSFFISSFHVFFRRRFSLFSKFNNRYFGLTLHLTILLPYLPFQHPNSILKLGPKSRFDDCSLFQDFFFLVTKHLIVAYRGVFLFSAIWI